MPHVPAECAKFYHVINAITVYVAFEDSMSVAYTSQVQWICDRAGPPDGLPARIVRYLGLLSCGSGRTLEMLLRAKCLILIAITLKRRSLR